MKFNKKLTSLVLAVVLLLALSAGAFAAPVPPGVNIYVTTGNFTSTSTLVDGIVESATTYTGGTYTPHIGTKNANFDIFDDRYHIFELEQYIDQAFQEYFYLPEGDPGIPVNVLDSLIWAFLEDGSDPSDITAGWDANPVAGAPGGYISNVYPQTISYYTPDYVTVSGVSYPVVNGMVTVANEQYYVYAGTGWNIAISRGGDEIQELEALEGIDMYATSIELGSEEMKIIFDISPYVLLWPAG